MFAARVHRVKITVALAGEPRTALVLGSGAINGISREDLERPYDERPKVELDVSEGDTLRTILQRAIEHWEIQASPREPIDSIGRIDFYDTGRIPRLQTELPVLDANGRVRWVGDWQQLTYGELRAAGDADVLPGDPSRPYLLLDPGGYGNGLLVDWQTLATVWEAFWYVLDKIDVAGGVYAAKKLVYDRLRERTKDAPAAVRSHYQEWQERGARPDNVDELLGRRPWHADDFAERFGCTRVEAEAFLLGVGYSQGAADMLYRRGEDAEARLLHGNYKLVIHVAMTRERGGVEDMLRERVESFLSTGEAPPLDWSRVREVPRDRIGFRDPEQIAAAERATRPGALRRLWETARRRR